MIRLLALLLCLVTPASAQLLTMGAGGVGAAGPCTLTGAVLTSSVFTGGSTSGTNVGTASGTQIGGCSGSPTVALGGGGDAASFTFSGTTLQLNATLATGLYAVPITVTNASAVNSPQTYTVSVTGLGQTWNPSDKSSSVTLSNFNNTASVNSGTGGWVAARATASNVESPGTKYYFEVTLTSIDSTTNGFIIGLGTSASTLANYPGSENTSQGFQCDNSHPAGFVYYNGGLVTSGAGPGNSWFDSCNVGDTLGVAVDFHNAKVWIQNISHSPGVWNQAVPGTQDPTSNLGGIHMETSILAAGAFPMFGGQYSTTPTTAIINMGDLPWKGSLPSGYWPWATFPTIASVSLSSNTVTAGSAINTVVGAITVGMLNATSFTGSFNALTGTDAASFHIVGSNLETNVSSISAGTYNININATQAHVHPTNPFSQPEVITASSGAPTITAITLSNNTFVGGAPTGTPVGTLSTTVSSGSFGGTYTVSDTTHFQISGSTVETNGTVAAGSYSGITFTGTDATFSNSPFTSSPSITITGSTSTFDPANKSANITLSGGNLTASNATSSSWSSVASTTSHSSGKYYFEMQPTAMGNGGNGQMLGFGSALPGAYPGSNATSYGYQCHSNPTTSDSYYNGSSAGTNRYRYCSVNDVMGFAIDLTAQKVWIQNCTAATGWNVGTGGTQDPASGAGGLSISGISGSIFALWGGDGSSTTSTVVFNPSGLSGNTCTIPSGFNQWN